MIDLNTCRKGQPVQLRSGEINFYGTRDPDCSEWQHKLGESAEGPFCYSYRTDGTYGIEDKVSLRDVVKILPFEYGEVKPVAWVQGYRSHVLGLNLNPHRPCSEEGLDWDAGRRQAAEDEEDRKARRAEADEEQP